MSTCVICRFPTVLDDVQLRGPRGRCVCVRCYLRETDTLRTVPAALRRRVEAILATAAEGRETAVNGCWP